MARSTATPDIELIIEQRHSGGGGVLPPPGGDGGDSGNGHPRRDPSASQRRYSTAVVIGIVSISMFFLALAGAFLALRWGSQAWATIHLPRILWVNTLILIASSFTLKRARARLSVADTLGFRRLWALTVALGFLFVAGQLVAWRQLVAQGVYISNNQASSFFYIFTGAHAVHLLGGVAGLLFVLLRNFEKSQVSLATAAGITCYYWHFMDGLWVFLLALLYLAK